MQCNQTIRDDGTYFWWVLTGIGLIGVSIRIFSLFQKELCFWDEGIFLMGCKFLRWRLHYLFHYGISLLGFQTLLPDPSTFQGYPVFLQKPFHVVLLTLSSLEFRQY